MLTANTDDWMTTLLRSPVFQRLTPMNLQKVLLSLEQVEFNSGEIVIDQGTEGDYYYLIKTGRCLLTRKPTPLAKEVKIRELADGDTFGEDALITGGKRDLTITAVEHSVMLRLDKQRFITMIKEPVLAFVDSEQMYEAVAKNTSILLDVRTPEEYQNAHLPGSINRPFFALRMQIKSLDREKKYIVICNDGKVSEAAAFLLLKNNFEARILKDGLVGQQCSTQVERCAK